MDKSISLGTKTLVELIRHYIWDLAYFPYLSLQGDITFSVFFTAVVFKFKMAFSSYLKLDQTSEITTETVK